MLKRLVQTVRLRVKRLRDWYELSPGIGAVEERMYYNRVVKQASGIQCRFTEME